MRVGKIKADNKQVVPIDATHAVRIIHQEDTSGEPNHKAELQVLEVEESNGIQRIQKILGILVQAGQGVEFTGIEGQTILVEHHPAIGKGRLK